MALSRRSLQAGFSSCRNILRQGCELGSIASRVSNLPGKLCMKLQHDPLSSDSWHSHHAGGLRSNTVTTEAFLPVVLVADPVFSIQQDSGTESEKRYLHQETSRLPSTGCPSYNASVDAEIHEQQNGPSISYHCRNSSSPENCSGDPTYTLDSKQLLLPGMQRTGFMINGSLHNIKTTSVLPENSSSQDTIVDPPPPLPIPPMQWLSVKVHTGPITHRKPLGKDPAGTSKQSGAEINSQQEPRQHLAAADSDNDMQVPDRATEKVFYPKGPEISSSPGNTLSDSEENKHSHNATQVDVQNADSCQGDEGNNLRHENVFFSAMEQLARMSPPRGTKAQTPPVSVCISGQSHAKKRYKKYSGRQDCTPRANKGQVFQPEASFWNELSSGCDGQSYQR